MLVPNQKIKIKWNNCCKKWYEDRGYIFTKSGEEFVCNAEDLTEKSNENVNAICDGCEKLFSIRYYNYTRNVNKNGMYLCKNCVIKQNQDKLKDGKYEVFTKWCEKNLYTPISTKEDCVNSKAPLYYDCKKHGICSATYTRIKSGQNVGLCCKSEYLREHNGNRIPILELKNTIEENGSKLLNPEDYISTKTKNLKIICPSCNDLYLTNFTLYRMSTGFCPNCGFEIGQKSKELSLTKIKYNKYSEKCRKMNYKETLTEEDFSNIFSSDNISFVCPSHGYIEQSYNHFINNDSTICYKCAKESMANIQRLDKDAVSNIISSKNNNVLLNPDEYIKNDKRNLEVLCGTCNKTFLTSLVIYNNNIDGKCPDCSERSYGEYVVALILDKYNVNYTRQESFNGDCHDKKPMPFDFYLPDYNLCIEYDGQGHYEPCFGEGSFKNTILHDSMKNWYCKWNNINLLRIPYWDFNNIESILIEKLNLTYFKSQTKHIKIKYISRKVINK